ncbi:hypothetical protein GCM10007884_26510 [Methylobacterium brachythecii]|uniref:Uncharacterized protein n=1 Tax=Methylobacterium brachythecii TaxID=1176177 RepID=A0ABQ6D8M7_9HYPH|nr:hypothetical protein GCM10007884_26510 [Methylobacterium brachythecii]
MTPTVSKTRPRTADGVQPERSNEHPGWQSLPIPLPTSAEREALSPENRFTISRCRIAPEGGIRRVTHAGGGGRRKDTVRKTDLDFGSR